MESVVLAGDFAVGQIWNYQTRENESGSKLTIVKIDNFKDEKIIHISVDGLRIKNPQAPTGYGENVSHLPISIEALKSSVIKISGNTTTLPDYQEGYQIWKQAFDSGKGGYFTITVAECIEYIEQTINQ